MAVFGRRVLTTIRSERARAQARAARREALVLMPVTAGIALAFSYRERLFGMDVPVRIAAAVAMMLVGLRLARAVGRSLGPVLVRRVDPATAGTLGFLVRLAAAGLTVLVALRFAGIGPRTLAVGGAFTAVVVGLAAQQTLGNLIAGVVLLSARPFQTGDALRLQGGGLAGMVEGTVESLGLLHLTLARGADRIMVPNSVALACAVIPLREPAAVDVVARLRRGVLPSDVQRILDRQITVPTRQPPHIDLEEIDDEETVVRITAVPAQPESGASLADEVLVAIERATHDAVTREHAAANGG